jgi:hypothetical protein
MLNGFKLFLLLAILLYPTSVMVGIVLLDPALRMYIVILQTLSMNEIVVHYVAE